MKIKNHVYSLLAISAFFLIAVASKVNKIHGGAFSTEVKTEEKGTGNFILLKDGSRVTGKTIKWQVSTFGKDWVQIDDQRFALADVQGYMKGGNYWIKHNNDFIMRIVHGKLNVYRHSYQATSTTTDHNNRTTRTSFETRYWHYVQRGENGSLTSLANQKDIREAVQGCPLAVSMADLPDRKIRRAVRANRRYLNEIFEIYNNDCKPVR